MTYPDNFMDEAETTISVISGLADDPKMKAIIVNQAIPGTTEAFRRIKERRPDILTIAGEAHEDPGVIQSAADLAVNNDFVARGYLIIRTAHELGCDTFVHISFPRHLSYETMSRRVAIMRATCEEFGMKFVMETAPDPTSDVGVAGAQQYILEKVPAWIETYGQNAAFFCTNDAHTEPLLKQLMTMVVTSLKLTCQVLSWDILEHWALTFPPKLVISKPSLQRLKLLLLQRAVQDVLVPGHTPMVIPLPLVLDSMQSTFSMVKANCLSFPT